MVNTGYLSQNRGIAKIVEIIIGFILCSLLCGVWYGGFNQCFYDGRVGFASGVNFAFLIGNIIFFVLNLIEAGTYKIERLYTLVACVFFLIASILIIWHVIVVEQRGHGDLFAAAVLIVVEFILHLWELKILQGQASNY